MNSLRPARFENLFACGGEFTHTARYEIHDGLRSRRMRAGRFQDHRRAGRGQPPAIGDFRGPAARLESGKTLVRIFRDGDWAAK